MWYERSSDRAGNSTFQTEKSVLHIQLNDYQNWSCVINVREENFLGGAGSHDTALLISLQHELLDWKRECHFCAIGFKENWYFSLEFWMAISVTGCFTSQISSLGLTKKTVYQYSSQTVTELNESIGKEITGGQHCKN